ncbi:NADH-quinone oxidoreductase subunit L [Mucisphaera calidilacus]|uniref:NADH-quinone oxidoreductase subunit L n=1 Tax=Mucisphaera calidilacus TaxID=2527982 RepID=A0A518BWC1_9BACT|nr:NADH-quinone oxidoreductase subunit L [Mucisphaera calidilacus]QDU71275.1 NADH-quinone oxidoreductase subunit L [Mucisphaera calidilacus]
MQAELANLIPWIPLLGAALCALGVFAPGLGRFAGTISVVTILASFLITAGVTPAVMEAEGSSVATVLYPWLSFGFESSAGGLRVDFGYLIDPLTLVMLWVVTGIGTLIALYATGYMRGDPGYSRFFAGVCLFIFAMTTLVMADNLLVLFLGWEGVGLASYLLIGHEFHRDAAAKAAKKAFVFNRIGDLGFVLGIFLAYQAFGTITLSGETGVLNLAAGIYAEHGVATWASRPDLMAIPLLLILGAAGKSAQIPLYVWLPDAMEGPTPVSALIHAATMVTAGVYLVARMMPVFALSPVALTVLAVVGGLTALIAGLIAVAQHDIKRVFAYSTVSQLGYMFLALGAMGSFAAVFHLVTHAFFKALLFLTAGSVMHAMAGQLDLRKMSGLFGRLPVTAVLMLIGCLALAGFPLMAGFFSKDAILYAVFTYGSEHDAWLYPVLGWVAVATAGLTAFYTFRVWFRVFMGPSAWEMGDHHHDDEHGVDEPHEMPWWPMNAPLVVLALGAIFGGALLGEGVIGEAISHSSANPDVVAQAGHAAGHHEEHHHATLLGMDVHTAVAVLGSIAAFVGLGLAAWFHLVSRAAGDAVAAAMGPIREVLEQKLYVDEIYHAAVGLPSQITGFMLTLVDQLGLRGLVQLLAVVPQGLSMITFQQGQTGRLQGYALGMALGVGVICLLMYMALT